MTGLAPQTLAECVSLVRGLMEDDPATFKAGYTLDNAVIAAAEVSGFSEGAIRRALVRADRDAKANRYLVAAATSLGDVPIGSYDHGRDDAAADREDVTA